MYQQGDVVLYGAEGVCHVTGTTQRKIEKDLIDYLVLKPVYNEASTLYVPLFDPSFVERMVRPVLTKDEVLHVIATMPQAESFWFDSDIERKERYKAVLKEGNRDGLVRMIKTLWLRQRDLKQQGRKLHMADEFFLKEAEKLLYSEFAYVLEIDRNDVLPMIKKSLDA